jgi:hypothetical protein
MFEDDRSFFSQAERGNDGSFAEFRLVVAMQSHAVTVVSVVVQENAIEVIASHSLNAALDIEQGLRPGQRIETNARVCVILAWISIPGYETRL